MSSSPQLVCFGELLIDFVPTVNGVSLAEAPAFQKAPGGAPANVAVAAARLGTSVALMGKVGDDEFGKLLANILAENGVDISALLFDPSARTALAFVTLRNDGEREFMFYRHPSADMLLRPDEIDEALIRQATVFHYGSISLISEPSRSAHLHALEIAKSADCLLSYDPNLRLSLWDSAETARTMIQSIWQEADIIKINEDELAFLTDGKGLEAIDQLWHSRLKLLIVTEGREGCHYFSPTARGKVAGFSADAIDTTGAGDAFVGALLHQIIEDGAVLTDEQKLRRALRFANGAGALTTTQRGAIPALPTSAELNRWLIRK